MGVEILEIYDKVGSLIRNGEKAKIAILKEVVGGELDWFVLTTRLQKKYYDGNFVIACFPKEMENEGLIEKKVFGQEPVMQLNYI